MAFAGSSDVTASVSGAGISQTWTDATRSGHEVATDLATSNGRVVATISNVGNVAFNWIGVRFDLYAHGCDASSDSAAEADGDVRPLTLGVAGNAALCEYGDIDKFNLVVPRVMLLVTTFYELVLVALHFANI